MALLPDTASLIAWINAATTIARLPFVLVQRYP